MAYPRPRSRKKPVELIPVQALVNAVEEVRATGVEPPAIVSGRREWVVFKRQEESREFVRSWPGDADTFLNIPVCLTRVGGAPAVMWNMAEMEEALLAD